MSNISVLLHCHTSLSQTEQLWEFLPHLPAWRNMPNLADRSNHPDLHLVNDEENAATIEVIRQMIQEMSLAPYQADQSVFVIFQIDRASLPAQNALLKALEEPPAHVQIILTTANPERVLPTIRSRCILQTIDDPTTAGSGESFAEMRDIWHGLPQSSFAHIFALSEQCKDRSEALQFLEKMSRFLHHQNQVQPSANLTGILQKLLETQTVLEKNVNVRLALEEWLFAVKKSK